MPPRYAYWTILAGGLPTSFRATEREELLPTFNRLKEKQPDAEMKWFSRGKLWNSPEEARAASPARSWSNRDASDRPRRPRPDADDAAPRDERGTPAADGEERRVKDRWRNRPGADRDDAGERRGPKWRPGGNHADPRQPFIDAKKAHNQRARQDRYDRKQRGERDDRPEAPREKRPFVPRDGAGERRFEPRAPREDRPRFDRPQGDREPRFDRPADDQIGRAHV